MTASIEKKAQLAVERLGLTPGKWAVSDGLSGVYAIDAQTGTRRMFARIFWGNGPPNANDAEMEMQANARLMAGAKGLLAVAFMTKEFESHAGGTHLPANAWFKLHEALDLAIKKVTTG